MLIEVGYGAFIDPNQVSFIYPKKDSETDKYIIVIGLKNSPSSLSFTYETKEQVEKKFKEILEIFSKFIDIKTINELQEENKKE